MQALTLTFSLLQMCICSTYHLSIILFSFSQYWPWEKKSLCRRQSICSDYCVVVFLNRQLLSWYTLSQNANVPGVDNIPALLPVWVRCDMSDPAGTTWFGAETICMNNRVSGVKLYSVSCKGTIEILRISLNKSPLKHYILYYISPVSYWSNLNFVRCNCRQKISHNLRGA